MTRPRLTRGRLLLLVPLLALLLAGGYLMRPVSYTASATPAPQPPSTVYTVAGESYGIHLPFVGPANDAFSNVTVDPASGAPAPFNPLRPPPVDSYGYYGFNQQTLNYPGSLSQGSTCSAAQTAQPVYATPSAGAASVQVGSASVAATCGTVGPTSWGSSGSSSQTTTYTPGNITIDLTQGLNTFAVGAWVNQWQPIFGGATYPPGITSSSTVTQLITAEGSLPHLVLTGGAITETMTTAPNGNVDTSISMGAADAVFGYNAPSLTSSLFSTYWAPYQATYTVSASTGYITGPTYSSAVPSGNVSIRGSRPFALPNSALAGTPLYSVFYLDNVAGSNSTVHSNSVIYNYPMIIHGFGSPASNGTCYGLCFSPRQYNLDVQQQCNDVLSVSSGNNQTAVTGSSFASPLVVSETCGGVAPAQSAALQVNWSAPSNTGASIAAVPNSYYPDSSGQVSVPVAADSYAGTYQVTASLADGAYAVFTLTNVSGVPVVVTTTTIPPPTTTTTLPSPTITTLPPPTTTTTTLPPPTTTSPPTTAGPPAAGSYRPT